MADWTNPANGTWTDAARWTGGVPNAAGAIASFTVPNPGNATVLINFLQNQIVTVGTLNIATDSDQGWLFQGDTGVTSATLRFLGAGGGPAFLNVDTNNSSRQSSISDSNGMNVTLGSDLIVTTADSDTFFEIRAPITGAFDLYKFGSGTFRLSGGNAAMSGDLFLNGGRTELTSGNAMGGGGLITLNKGATLAGVNTFTLANDIETGAGNATGSIVAKTGTTLTLTGGLELRSGTTVAISFGSAADAGTIVLSGTSLISGNGGFDLAGGTLRFGTAAAAANYFANLSSSGALQVRTGATLDTGGFAATIEEFDMDGGTLRASSGALNLTSDQHGQNGQEGTVVGTAQADSLVFNLTAGIDLSGLAFSSWTDGADTITINGNASANGATGSARNDTINGGGGDDALNGGAGSDVLNGGTGADKMSGSSGDDIYLVDNAGDILVEGTNGGFDTAFTSISYTLGAGVHAEILSVIDWSATTALNLTGNELANRLYGNAGANVLTGGLGDDWLAGLGGGDTLVGGGGDDSYWIYALDDGITETAGNGFDTAFLFTSYALDANANVEVVSTYSWIQGEAINLTGNGLSNILFGNVGANVLNGGLGNDRMTGFAGADTFAFTTALGADNADTVADFVHGTDRIALDDAIFTQIGGLGALNANAFVTGSAAGDADDRIVYNSATGQLFYDADGNGGGAAILFASLTGNPTLSASDFLVI